LTDQQPSPEALRRILLVDDDRDALQILGDLLRSRHYAVVTALDGHEALARFHDDGPFDIIVLDVMMPGIDGLEVCRRLKASPQGLLTPVLLVSARSDTRSRVAGLYGGADDYMSKPIDLREFAARVDALLRVRERYSALAERRTQELDAALIDGLTGLLRGRYFLRRLSEEIVRADRYKLKLSVLILDLFGLPEPEAEADEAFDEPSSFDMTFAGPADRLVAAAGRAMRAGLRAGDLTARIRRSRFAIMLPHTARRTVRGIVKRLEAAVAAIPADPERPDGPAAGLSLKIGQAELGPKMGAEGLMARAEPG
jgi:PleD family two-component response regulator